MATDLSISQLPLDMKVERGITKNSYDQVSTTDLAQRLKERAGNNSSTSMITVEKQLKKNSTKVFPQAIEVGAKNISDYEGILVKKLDKNQKVFTNEATKDLSKSLILH